MSLLEAIRFDEEKCELEILDQLKLPTDHVYEKVAGIEDAWRVIREMKVRGAPAIAIVGCLALAVELNNNKFLASFKDDPKKFIAKIEEKLDYLETSRPTAVNLRNSCLAIKGILKEASGGGPLTLEIPNIVDGIRAYCLNLFKEDVKINKAIGDFGAKDILSRVEENQGEINILTHCNTGSLATAGYGTALGVIRSVHLTGRLNRAFCTETRPYNQGSRLTAYELVFEKIPSELICDNMVAALMNKTKLSAVVVGADRVVANGDTANKIGTYQLAVLAKHHGVPFYVASPVSTVDLSVADGSGIPIEERNEKEMTSCGCEKKIRTAAKGISVWNPAFDATPAELITGGIITEFGVLRPPLDSKENRRIMNLL